MMTSPAFFRSVGLCFITGLCSMGCQPAIAPDVESPALQSATTPFVFDDNPGIRSTQVSDVSGQLTGTFDGQPVQFGPDKAALVESVLYFADPSGVDPTAPLSTNAVISPALLSINAYTNQVLVRISLRQPFRVGDYRWVADGVEADAPGTALVTATGPIGQPVTATFLKTQLTGTERFRVTSISPDWIDGELSFTLNKPGAQAERIAFRIKNQLNENTNRRAQAPTEPFWNYNEVVRQVETAYRYPTAEEAATLTPATYRGATRTGVATRLLHQPATPVSNLTLNGTPYRIETQITARRREQQPNQPAELHILLGTSIKESQTYPSADIELTIPDFRGVGSYTGSQVSTRIFRVAKQADWWIAGAAGNTAATTRVDITRVTPDLIEGTYSIQNAQVTSQAGTPAPAAVTATGSLRVIYPR